MTKHLAIHWAQRLPRCAALGRRRSCGSGCDAFAVHSGWASRGQQHGSLWASCRVAGWGAIGGVLLAALFVTGASLGWGEVLAISTTFALASAVSASGSLVLAGRAVRRELPDSRGDTAEAELTDYEKRQRLGGGN